MVVLPDQLMPRMRAEGIDDAIIDRLVGQNVAEFLARREG
jgi:hypothetical protein